MRLRHVRMACPSSITDSVKYTDRVEGSSGAPPREKRDGNDFPRRENIPIFIFLSLPLLLASSLPLLIHVSELPLSTSLSMMRLLHPRRNRHANLLRWLLFELATTALSDGAKSTSVPGCTRYRIHFPLSGCLSHIRNPADGGILIGGAAAGPPTNKVRSVAALRLLPGGVRLRGGGDDVAEGGIGERGGRGRRGRGLDVEEGASAPRLFQDPGPGSSDLDEDGADDEEGAMMDVSEQPGERNRQDVEQFGLSPPRMFSNIDLETRDVATRDILEDAAADEVLSPHNPKP